MTFSRFALELLAFLGLVHTTRTFITTRLDHNIRLVAQFFAFSMALLLRGLGE